MFTGRSLGKGQSGRSGIDAGAADVAPIATDTEDSLYVSCDGSTA